MYVCMYVLKFSSEVLNFSSKFEIQHSNSHDQLNLEIIYLSSTNKVLNLVVKLELI